MSNNKNSDKKVKIMYIIFSVIASIALWVYVAYVVNAEQHEVTISGITVEFTGEERLLDNDLIVTNIDTDTLNITFSGMRDKVLKLSNSNVTATVDLTEILSSSAGAAGTYQLSYKLNYQKTSNGITVEHSSKDYITVTVEKMITKTVSVSGLYDGGVAEGYMAESPQVSPDTLIISGPQAIISQISYASAKLDRKDLSKSVSEQVPVTLMDEDGNVISQDNLILSSDTVTISLSVLMVKDVPLEINLVEGASATKGNTHYDIEPKYVTLSGDPEILESINVITLGTIDLTSFITSYTDTYTITIPNNLDNLTGATTATVTVEVLNTDTKRLSANNIKYRNATEGSNVNIVTQSLDITLRGQDEDLEQITSDNIRIVADLSELGNTIGTFSVPAKVYVDGFSNVDAVGEYKVTVTIS